MRKLRIYLDTSVINFLFAEDAPEKKAATETFFDQVGQQQVPVFISQLVLDEISRTSNTEKRERLLEAIRRHSLPLLPAEPLGEIEDLVSAYIEQGAIPAGQPEDALHVALCTVNMIDVLVTWNFKHLANIRRERRILAVNESLGYVYPLRITTPQEAITDE